MLSCLSTSFGTASTFSHFGERFRDGDGHYIQFGQFLVCF